MSHKWYFKSGDWNAICQSCGKKFKASELRKRWDGLYVCEDDFEQRHPQDLLRARMDKISPPWASPRPADVFVPLNFTQFPTDTIQLDETIGTVADFYRYVGAIDISTTDVDVINGSALNLAEINHSSTDPSPPVNEEMFSLDETIVLSQGFGVVLSDSFSLNESIVEEEGEFSIDTFAISETVVAFLVSNKILNAHTPNEVTLG